MVEFTAGDPLYPTTNTTMQFSVEGAVYTATTTSTTPYIKYKRMAIVCLPQAACVFSLCSCSFFWNILLTLFFIGTHRVTDGRFTLTGSTNSLYRATTKINFIKISTVVVTRAEADIGSNPSSSTSLSTGAVVGIVVAAVLGVAVVALIVFVVVKARAKRTSAKKQLQTPLMETRTDA